jgi:hypothetical protein
VMERVRSFFDERSHGLRCRERTRAGHFGNRPCRIWQTQFQLGLEPVPHFVRGARFPLQIPVLALIAAGQCYFSENECWRVAHE